MRSAEQGVDCYTLQGLSLDMSVQAWDNFKKEFQQIRRSFRFNEYAEISRANPPSNALERVRKLILTKAMLLRAVSSERSP